VPGAGARDAAATRLATVASEGIAAGGAAGGARVLLVACAEVADDVPAALRRCFTHELALDAPDEPHRVSLLRGALAARRADGAALAAAAAQAGGLLPRDLRAVAADAAAAAVGPRRATGARGGGRGAPAAALARARRGRAAARRGGGRGRGRGRGAARRAASGGQGGAGRRAGGGARAHVGRHRRSAGAPLCCWGLGHAGCAWASRRPMPLPQAHASSVARSLARQ